jgi:hypothetical protein
MLEIALGDNKANFPLIEISQSRYTLGHVETYKDLLKTLSMWLEENGKIKEDSYQCWILQQQFNPHQNSIDISEIRKQSNVDTYSSLAMLPNGPAPQSQQHFCPPGEISTVSETFMREINGILSKYKGEFQMHPMKYDFPGHGFELPGAFLASTAKSESLDHGPPNKNCQNLQNQSPNIPSLDYCMSQEFKAWSPLVESKNQNNQTVSSSMRPLTLETMPTNLHTSPSSPTDSPGTIWNKNQLNSESDSRNQNPLNRKRCTSCSGDTINFNW